jgi:hypothetical protein
MSVHGTTSHRSVTSRPRGGRTVVHRALLAVVAVVVMATGVACGSAAKPSAAPSSPSATTSATSTTSTTDAAALLRASAAAMDTQAKTAAFTMKVSSTATLNGATNVIGMELAGELDSNGDSIRGTGTATYPGVGAVSIEFIGVTSDGYVVAYIKVIGRTGWEQQPREQSDVATTSAQDAEEALGAAKSVTIVRSETVHGLLCDVVQVDLDLAAYDKANKSLGLADSVSRQLHISLADATAALSSATGTKLMWIGRTDHFVYRDSGDYIVDVGTQGKYEEQALMDCFDFGKVVDPPITAPIVSGSST